MEDIMNMKSRIRIFLFCFLISFIIGIALPAEEQEAPSGFSAVDTLRINGAGSPRISPNGKWVLYTLTVRDMEDEEMKASTHIWRVRVDGTERRQMTFGDANCSSPTWCPCGKKIAFLSPRGKAGSKSQIHFLRMDGGEAWKVFDHKEGIQSFRISPDGQKILFVARDALSEEEEEKRKQKDDAEVVDETFRWSHVWIYDMASKQADPITEGNFVASDPRWSPDAKRIAYVRRPNTKNDESWNTDIWVADLATKSSIKLYENPGADSSPRWSPDGKSIAFSSSPHSTTTTMYSKLYIIPAQGGSPKVFLEDFDRNFGAPIWSPDGKSIYWSTGDKTTINMFLVDLQSGSVGKLTPPRGGNFSFDLSVDGSRWVWSHRPGSWPTEIHSAGKDLSDPVLLSDANSWLREEKKEFSRVQVIDWTNADNQRIEGVLTFPAGYQEGKRYPLILNPHGGPSGAVSESFSATNQYFASNGYMVLQPNFRGSSNYGQKFLNANRKNWGVVDYDDCMTGVDFCVDQGWADPSRLVCYGWSYGGYMSFWIVTQTDRFKAVSPGAGLPNLYSMYSTTDIPRYLAWFFGTPWDNEDLYRKHSPIRHVKNVKSPVLILHGASDTRVPPSQAVEFYQALKDLGKDVTFVRYPREGHGFREPRHQLDRLRRWLYFFGEHIGLDPVTEKKPTAGEDKK